MSLVLDTLIIAILVPMRTSEHVAPRGSQP